MSGSEGTGFRTGTQERVMKAAAFRVGMSRLLPASLGPRYSGTSVESVPRYTGTCCITCEGVEVLMAEDSD